MFKLCINLKTTKGPAEEQQLLPQQSWCHPLFIIISPAGVQKLCFTFPSGQNTSSPHRETQVSNSMKCLNNRAGSHLTGQVECELDSVSNGAWVNQGFCASPPPLPRAVSTIYNPQPLFQGSMDSMYKVDTLGPFPEEPPCTDRSPEKKQRGCCSFIKGRNPFIWV